MSWKLLDELQDYGGHISGHARNALVTIALAAHHETDPAHEGGKLRRAGAQRLPARQCFLTEGELMRGMGLERPAILDREGAQERHPTEYAKAMKQLEANRKKKRRALAELEKEFGLPVRVRSGRHVAFRGRASTFAFPTVAQLEASRRQVEWRTYMSPIEGR